ncbi:adenylate/guanylate cyclase domain-containing protein [Rhodobacteraceae bacterium M382]|nr:adenylate/guanylate cyclase domain-containing protein [Rhodobacteraceae bacterium M382]
MVAEPTLTLESAGRAMPLISWLMQQGLQGAGQQEMLQGYCQRLEDMGVPLWRLHLAQRAFHPKFGGLGFSWTRADGLSHEHYEHRDSPLDEWVRSPFYQILTNGLDEFRAGLDVNEDFSVFPLLEDLRGQGATEYFATGLWFEKPDDREIDPNHAPEGVLISWTTDRLGGFEDDDLNIIRGSLPYLGLALKSSSNRQMAADLLRVYLGRDAGKRVLSGEIQRGSSQRIDAVICYFDLKDFTSLAESIPGTELIEMLNDYFALAVATIQNHGGNILKFMGDGMLTMFDLGSIEEDATAALNAASELQVKIRDLNRTREAQGLTTTGFTLALHAGEILYGNIGAENRLDFTVIGPTVNLTSRISGMHRSVGQSIIISEHVHRAAQPASHDLVSLGRYMLRGVAAPIELFTIFEG